MRRNLRRNHIKHGDRHEVFATSFGLIDRRRPQASAQETTQGQICAEVAVMPPPAGDAPNRVLSDDAEVADRIVVSKKTIAPGQAMGHGQVVLNAGLLHHVAVEYRRSTPCG